MATMIVSETLTKVVNGENLLFELLPLLSTMGNISALGHFDLTNRTFNYRQIKLCQFDTWSPFQRKNTIINLDFYNSFEFRDIQ